MGRRTAFGNSAESRAAPLPQQASPAIEGVKATSSEVPKNPPPSGQQPPSISAPKQKRPSPRLAEDALKLVSRLTLTMLQAVQSVESFGHLIHNYDDMVATHENTVARLTDELKGVKTKAHEEAIRKMKKAGMMELAREVEGSLKDRKDIKPILEKYADRLSGGTTVGIRLRLMTRKHFRDADLSVQDFFKEMEKVLPNISSPVDLLNTSAGPSFIYNMPANVGSPAEMPPGPMMSQSSRDIEIPWIVICRQETQLGRQLQGPTRLSPSRGFPTPEVDIGVTTGATYINIPSTSEEQVGERIPHVYITLPEPEFNPGNYPYYSTIGKIFARFSFQKEGKQLPILEGELRSTIRAIHATELKAPKKIISDLKVKASNLWQLNEDQERYWEDHLKNAVKMDNLNSERLRQVEAKLRKQKRNNGRTTPDLEDFIPRNYHEGMLSHLQKVYALVAVRWDKASEKIDSLRDYENRLTLALQQVVSDFIELGGTFNPEAQWPDGCEAMKDTHVSPTA
ncbi:OLC1v1024992C1 [Oldenlandia corymbosa var. corymbosa]|uniref:OLC1v1024992C1 n=1 Tax=Oldenlandia corymbosa var. corymbosa TaxID=529605 RepID=A0AAV1C3P2_OLDCO|nr:OLC1v1024992C1 [Oldenlandia corymbosa var. corymbosa]